MKLDALSSLKLFLSPPGRTGGIFRLKTPKENADPASYSRESAFLLFRFCDLSGPSMSSRQAFRVIFLLIHKQAYIFSELSGGNNVSILPSDCIIGFLYYFRKAVGGVIRTSVQLYDAAVLSVFGTVFV